MVCLTFCIHQPNLGCLAILQEQLSRNNIKVARVSGASAGAWSALFLCANIPTSLVLESYHMTAENPKKFLHDVYTEDLVSSEEWEWVVESD